MSTSSPQNQAAEEHVQQDYQLRSVMFYFYACVAMTLLCLVPLGIVLARPDGFGRSYFLPVSIGLLLVPAALWSSRKTYLLPDGAAILRISPSGLSLLSRSRSLFFPVETLQFHTVDHRASVAPLGIPMGNFRTDMHLHIGNGKDKLSLSRKLLENPDDMERVVADIERILAGVAPSGKSAKEEEEVDRRRKPEDREAEDQLDAELAMMD